jgi:Fe-S-cluster containining protein
MKWYQKGLHFKCKACGGCCCGFPGHVWLSKKDIQKAAKLLKIPEEEFLKKYTRIVNGRRSLIEKSNYDCIFIQEKKCQIYEARPIQCKTFPFWPENLQSKKNWENAEKSCPGMQDKTCLYSLEEIEKILMRYLENFPT